MAISVRHPIKAKIDDSYHFIKDLLSEHLAFLNKWELSTKIEFKSYAKAEEDPEIRYTISSQYSTVFDDADYRKNLLLQAILILSSCVSLLSFVFISTYIINTIKKMKSYMFLK